jgi:hypothetical protein
MKRRLTLIGFLLAASAHAGAQNIDSMLCKIHDLDQGVRREFIEAYKSGVTDSLLVLNERMAKIDHADVSAQQKYLPLVREQADRGVIDIGLWATLYDRVLMYTGKKQIYGTQIKTFFDKSQGARLLYLWPLEDPANVDKLREEAGLPPLEQGADVIRDDSISVKELRKMMRKQRSR